jgi:hypothetical protein
VSCRSFNTLFNLSSNRFDDKVAGSDVDRLFIGEIVTVPGYDDDIGSIVLLDNLGKLQPPNAGQNDIGDNDMKSILL